MTPSSNLPPRASDPINGGWLVFGSMLAESFGAAPRPASLHPQEARALRRAGRPRRFLAWWTRPLPEGIGTSARDAATRLEILDRGGFPR